MRARRNGVAHLVDAKGRRPCCDRHNGTDQTKDRKQQPDDDDYYPDCELTVAPRRICHNEVSKALPAGPMLAVP